jgi:hypothetical protein
MLFGRVAIALRMGGAVGSNLYPGTAHTSRRGAVTFDAPQSAMAASVMAGAQPSPP